MKNNILKSIILSLLIVTGVSNAWAANGTITVYFKNTVNWSNVYVYFLTSSYWDNTYGCGSYGYTAKKMTYDNTLGLYKCEYTGNYSEYITFTKDEQNNYGNFHNTEAVYRSDFSTSNPIFIPSSTSNETKNNTIYYNNGSWVSTATQTFYYMGDLATPYAYYWNDNGVHSTWPGIKMTDSGKKYKGKTIYSVTTPYSFKNVIFSNNGEDKTSDLTLNAGKIYDQTNSKWIDYTYDVTIYFDGNGGKTYTQKATILYMAKQLNQEIVPPTRTGYTFDGWGNSGGNTKAIDAKGNLLPNASYGSLRYTDPQGRWIDPDGCMLYAHWLANQYLIKFDENGGTFTANGTKQIYATYNETVPNIGNGPDDIPWRRGYAFNGYTTNADGTGNQYYNKNGIGQIKFKQTKEVTVYAQWALETYTIAYELNGGTNHANNPNSYTYEDATITLQEPTKTGYTFNGWYDNSSFTGTPITRISKGSYGNKTLYAKWTANTYTVTLDQQSGTGGTTFVTATYGAAMPAITKPTRNGYTFGGYYTAINGGGTKYYNANGSSAKNWDKTAATTLYAKWTANQSTITWNANGGSVTPASSTYTYDGDPVALPTPTRTGYEFNGWFTASTGGTRISDVGKTNKPTSNTTYYAQWKAKTYIVTLDPQGGFSGSNSINATYDATLPAITPPTRDGYIFEGYYSEPNGQGKKYYNADGSSANLWDKENATLYAKWVEYAKCIFFKNNVSWSNVYVYTFSEEVWHNGNDQNNPNDDKGVQPKTNRIEFGQMTKLGETDIYYYILTNTTTGFNRIAFSNADMSGYDEFYQNQAVYRGDRTDQMPLFVPYKGASKTANSTTYYNEGVWMKYNSKESGYYLNIQNESSTALTAPSKGGYIFTATVYLAAGSGERTLDLTNLQDDVKFSKNQAMTTNSEIVLNKWGDYNAASTLKFTPSATGAYTFTLNLATGEVKLQATNPTIVTASEGDFRLIYVEQVVEKNSKNQTVITRKKMHPSDIIKKRTTTGTDIVSLHVYNKNTYEGIRRYVEDIPEYYTSPSNSAVVLQQYNNEGQWVDIEHHMVFGPLEALPGHALLPGRQEVGGDITSIEELIKQLRADYGIPNIVNAENHRYEGNGVWNFPIQQTVNGSNVTAELVRERVEPYTDTYYIRTACAAGGWDAYRAEEDNQMTYSQYAEGNKEFTHYYCKWVNLNKYVQFVVANNHSEAISDTLLADRTTLLGEALADNQIMVDSKGIVPEGANIRFSWKEWDNGLHRAYIGGSGEGDKDYLVLHDGSGDAAHHLWQFPESGDRLTDNKQTFSDNGGWMYQADVYAQTGTAVKMTAKYPLKANSQTQYFKGTEAETVPLIGGGADDTEKYPIRVLYDFKENRLITAYVPQAPETEDVAIETDLMIIRKDHNPANQLTLNNKTVKYAINSERTAYGAITFTKDHLISNNWAVTNDKTFYWISFPFDVKLSDAFGFGKYATHWYIEWYDGESRAENGLFLDSGTYWRYVTKSQAKDFVLKANTGYVLWLNVPRIQSDNLFVGETKEISIYFPSMIAIDADFEQYEDKNHTVAAHWRPEGSRRYNEDSNWNLIGVPSYANSQITTTLADGIKPEFLYTYLPATDTYDPQAAGSTNFQSMYAYMVQFAGTITWAQLINDHDPIPSSIAARQSTADEMHQPMLRVELQQNNKYADQTFVKMQAEDATNAFDMNKDLTKVINKTPNLYSITSDNVDVAGNVMPLAETIVPLGVDLQTAGEYTFAMPDGTEGMVVELIDYETNTRTNLLLDNYTVTLSAGINETRFALSIRPDKTATSVENIADDAKGAKKYIIDGNLYLQTDSALYDAQGHIVR